MTPLAMRLSTHSLPARLSTGDPRLDAHLAALDATLSGFPAVRRETLLEAREFLLDARDHAREAGLDEDAAAKEAIAQLGPIEDIAREQRAARQAIFRRLSFGMGLSFAGMMLLFSLLRTGWAAADGIALAGAFAFQTGFFGITMGYLLAYVVPRAQPAAEDAPAPGSFRVHFGPASVASAWAVAAVFGLQGVLLAVALAGHGPLASWPPALAVILLLMCLRLTLGALRAARFRALASDQALRIDSLFGQTRIARSAITGTARVTLPMQLLLPAMGPSHWIHWRDEAGRARRISVAVSGELVHGDRLIAWLEAAARANALSPAGAPSRRSAP